MKPLSGPVKPMSSSKTPLFLASTHVEVEYKTPFSIKNGHEKLAIVISEILFEPYTSPL